MKHLKHYLAIITLCTSSLCCSFTANADPAKKELEQTKHSQQTNLVNINTATAQELANGLTGIGLNKAKKIVEYREKFGAFVSIEQLKEVSGIGQSILDKNTGKIQL